MMLAGSRLEGKYWLTWQPAQSTACLKSSQIELIQLSASLVWAAVRDARGQRVARRTARLMVATSVSDTCVSDLRLKRLNSQPAAVDQGRLYASSRPKHMQYLCTKRRSTVRLEPVGPCRWFLKNKRDYLQGHLSRRSITELALVVLPGIMGLSRRSRAPSTKTAFDPQRNRC